MGKAPVHDLRGWQQTVGSKAIEAQYRQHLTDVVALLHQDQRQDNEAAVASGLHHVEWGLAQGFSIGLVA